MRARLRRVTNKIGIDKTVGYTILTRGLQAVGGVGALFFVTRYLNALEQGYYYTFASIIAIQIFFELGLSSIITQYAAHEFAHLNINSHDIIEGEAYYKSRLSSLLKFCVKWFSLLSGVLLLALMGAGKYFFSTYNANLNVEWAWPWVILSVSTALNLFLDPLLAFFEGVGQIESMSKLRFIQKTSYYILLYLLLFFHFKLYSAAIASIVSIIISYLQFFFSSRRITMTSIWSAQQQWAISYLKEIFPFQWKIALSWISGYLIFQLFSPVLFATEGAVVAGQMGISLAALNGIMAISLSWISTKTPLFSTLIARKEYGVLDNEFKGLVKRSTIACMIALAVFIGGVAILRSLNVALGFRFLAMIPLLLLSGSTLINQFVYALAAYLRSHKREPFLGLSIIMGVLSAASTIWLGKYFGVLGITAGYFTLTFAISLFGSLTVFIKKKKLWHETETLY
jgi:hypothetical protein